MKMFLASSHSFTVSNITFSLASKGIDDKECLGCSLLEVCDQIISVLVLLETTESHLGSGDVFLRVL